MKLYNKTRCPDEIVESLLLRAGKACGKVRTAGVIVIVTMGRTGRVRGMASQATAVRQWALRHRKKHDSHGNLKHRRWISTDGGYFTITLPQLGRGMYKCDPLGRAESFFRVAVHEWGHIRDYQAGGCLALPWAVKRQGKRRAAHDDRPEERRANRYTHEAESRIESGKVLPPDDAILSLAIWLEESETK